MVKCVGAHDVANSIFAYSFSLTTSQIKAVLRISLLFQTVFLNTCGETGCLSSLLVLFGTHSPCFPIEALFLRPDYATDTNPTKWRVEIISFSGLPGRFS